MLTKDRWRNLSERPVLRRRDETRIYLHRAIRETAD